MNIDKINCLTERVRFMETTKKRLWKTEQEILDVFHDICTQNNLRYSLAYGTLIGAVRHKGFIPWDDDIDVVMPREDYDKLIEIWGKSAPKLYLLQNPANHLDLANNFIKIRKDHTTFVMYESERFCSYHTGIFIDVFPLDRVAPTEFKQKMQKLYCMIALLFNRGYVRETGIMPQIGKIILSVLPRKKHKQLEDWFMKKSTVWNGMINQDYLSLSTISWMDKHYRHDAFNDMIQLEFEGKMYNAFSDYHEVLTREYGDYMKLPPKVEQVWKHHPLVIDFEHNYEEIEG